MPNVIDKSVSWIIFKFISINRLGWTIHNSAEGRLWHMDFCAITSIGCLPRALPQGGLYCRKRVCLLCAYRFKSMSSQTAATKFLSCRTSRADSHTVLDILPGSVPCTFFHSSAQLLIHICPQNHDHLYAALSGPEQWKLQFFQHQHYR